MSLREKVDGASMSGQVCRRASATKSAKLIHVNRRRAGAELPLSVAGSDSCMTAAANIYATRITHDNTAVSERHGRVAEEIRESPGAAGLFTTLGVQPLLGRDFRPDDGRPGPPSVVMLDHGYWMRAHGGAADSVGPSISVDGARIEVAGVMPSGFRIVQDADMTTDDIKAPRRH